jgi:hypothetical protein
MFRKDRNARAGSGRASLYDDITGKIIAELEAGRCPGSSPGDRPGQGAARHAEERRDRAALFGDQRADPLGRGDPARLSRPELAHLPPGPVAWRQCPPGERGTTVVYADRFTPEDEKRRARETGEEAAAIPFLKRFTSSTPRNATACRRMSPLSLHRLRPASSSRGSRP